MRTNSEKTLKMVQELKNAIDLRKRAEIAEKELKAAIKDLMGKSATLEAGELMIIIEKRSRTDLDRQALIQDFGVEVIEKYLKQSDYEILTIKALMRKSLQGAG